MNFKNELCFYKRMTCALLLLGYARMMENFTLSESIIGEHIIKIGLFAVVIYFLFYKWKLFQLDDNEDESFIEKIIPVLIALDGIKIVIEPYWNIIINLMNSYI